MTLKEYQRKRHFRRTPEPAGNRPAKKTPRALKFVIHRHAARSLHYDLRLEWEGVLKSWAVPKGLGTAPGEKHLAVQVEDHPLEYGKFEGTIPEGEYGAGEVAIWDQGTWEPLTDPNQGLREGKLDFVLYGDRYQGLWTLVRMKPRPRERQPQWLVIKKHDTEPVEEENASAPTTTAHKKGGRTPRKRAKEKSEADDQPTAAPLPSFVTPQLATLVDQVPKGKDWIFEIKYDGYRILARLDGADVRLITRNQQDWTHRYPAVAKALRGVPLQSALLDGELVALLEDGISSFQALQNAANGSARLVYYVFDLLYLDGTDLRRRPLLERKALLQERLAKVHSPLMQYCDHFEGNGKAFLESSCRMGLEGIICKRANVPYSSGRGKDWLKVKCQNHDEFVIGGFSPSPSADRPLGALLLGYFDQDKLRYAGRVGTGFTDRGLRDLYQRLQSIAVAESPFASVPRKEQRGGITWVRPELVAQVRFTGWTEDKMLRHPSFLGLREDKPATSVERPVPTRAPRDAVSENGKKPVKKKKATPSARGSQASDSNGNASPSSGPTIDFPLTHPERVLYPDCALTKAGLAAYYAAIHPWMLPQVADRPLSLVRCPDGVSTGKKACFFQKNVLGSLTATLRQHLDPVADAEHSYVSVDSLEGLLALVQMSVLEIHVWQARRDLLERPDQFIIDLDPDEGLPWGVVVEAARLTRTILHAHDLEAFLKTTGGKGLHLVVPIERRHDWPTVVQFAKGVGEELVRRHPDGFTTNMSKRARQGKIFVDYLRNTRGATAIAPFSTRARPGAPVSMPIAWEELSVEQPANRFTVFNAMEYLKSRRADPWKAIRSVKQRLPRASRAR